MLAPVYCQPHWSAKVGIKSVGESEKLSVFIISTNWQGQFGINRLKQLWQKHERAEYFWEG